MNYAVRELRKDEVKVLYNFLYETIFMPEGILAPSKDIINQPELWVYVNDFGDNKGDLCFIAQAKDEIVDAVWVCVMNDYGHVDNQTLFFMILLLKEYRNCRIGTELMKQILMKLKMQGHARASLPVQKMNYAYV